MKKRKQNWSAASRQMPAFKRVVDTNFLVDGFRYKSSAYQSYFLSHFHSDHYCGITKGFSFGTIYCSEITAKLVQSVLRVDPQYIKALPMHTPIQIDNAEVTLLPANHCPGAVLFLFNVQGKYILHVGDFRYTPSMKDYTELADIHVHTLYLDNTFCNPKHHFPPREIAVQMAVDIVLREINDSTLFLVGTYTIGKEDVYCSIARVCNRKVFVNTGKYSILKSLEIPDLDDIVTIDASKTNIHVVPMGHVSFNKMRQLYNFFRGRYTRIIGFHPTGWSGNDLKKEQSGNNLIIYHVPYSEHSNYYELLEFVEFLRPTVLIPTVGSTAKAPEVVKHFEHLLTNGRSSSMHSFLSPTSTLAHRRAPPPAQKYSYNSGGRAPLLLPQKNESKTATLFSWFKSIPASLSSSFSASSPSLPTRASTTTTTTTTPKNLQKAASSPALSTSRPTSSSFFGMLGGRKVHEGNRIVKHEGESDLASKSFDEEWDDSVILDEEGDSVMATSDTKEEDFGVWLDEDDVAWFDLVMSESQKQNPNNSDVEEKPTAASVQPENKDDDGIEEEAELKKEKEEDISVINAGDESTLEPVVHIPATTLITVNNQREKKEVICQEPHPKEEGAKMGEESFIDLREEEEVTLVDTPSCCITATTITTTTTTTSSAQSKLIDLTLEEEEGEGKDGSEQASRSSQIQSHGGTKKRPLWMMLGGEKAKTSPPKKKKLNLSVSKKKAAAPATETNKSDNNKENKQQQSSILASLFGFTSQKRSSHK